MGKFTQIMLKSKGCNEFGFPKRLSVYEIGEARQIGECFTVALMVLREHDLRLPRPPVQLQAESVEAARKLVIQHYRNLANEMKLDVWVTEFDEC
jgi:hypothetical protein